jgi:hypothetical protein
MASLIRNTEAAPNVAENHEGVAPGDKEYDQDLLETPRFLVTQHPNRKHKANKRKTRRDSKQIEADTRKWAPYRIIVEATFASQGWLAALFEIFCLHDIRQGNESAGVEQMFPYFAKYKDHTKSIGNFFNTFNISQGGSDCPKWIHALFLYAIDVENFEAVRRLVLQNQSLVNRIDQSTQTPLIRSVTSPKPQITLFLLQYGANISYEDRRGGNALWYANEALNDTEKGNDDEAAQCVWHLMVYEASLPNHPLLESSGDKSGSKQAQLMSDLTEMGTFFSEYSLRPSHREKNSYQSAFSGDESEHLSSQKSGLRSTSSSPGNVPGSVFLSSNMNPISPVPNLDCRGQYFAIEDERGSVSWSESDYGEANPDEYEHNHDCPIESAEGGFVKDVQSSVLHILAQNIFNKVLPGSPFPAARKCCTKECSPVGSGKAPSSSGSGSTKRSSSFSMVGSYHYHPYRRRSSENHKNGHNQDDEDDDDDDDDDDNRPAQPEKGGFPRAKCKKPRNLACPFQKQYPDIFTRSSHPACFGRGFRGRDIPRLK